MVPNVSNYVFPITVVRGFPWIIYFESSQRYFINMLIYYFSHEKNEVEKYEVINMGYHISRLFRPVKWQPQVSSHPGLFSQSPLRSPRTLPFSVPGIVANLTSASDSPCSLDVLAASILLDP